MDKFTQFLKKINVDQSIIDQLASEETIEEAIFDQLATNYSSSREKYFETQFLGTKKKEIEDSTITGYNLKIKKQVNKMLGMGLTNSQIDEMKDIEKFFSDANAFMLSELEKRTNTSDESLKKDLEKYKKMATEKDSEVQTLAASMEDFRKQKESEFERKTKDYKANIFISDLISKDTKIAEVPGREFSLGTIKRLLLENYDISEDGKITNKDGSSAVHPEKQLVIENAIDIYDFYKNKAGLVPQSNGGVGSYVDPNTGKKVIASQDPDVTEKLEEFKRMRTTI